MNANPTIDPLDLEKPPPTEAVEDVPPPAYDVVDLETAIPQSAPSPESRPVSRVKAFFLTILYTVLFVVMTLIFCLQGSLAFGSPHDKRSAALARAIYASILGSVALGPICFTYQRFMTFMKARNEAVNIHTANGRLLKALGHSVLLCAIVIGVVASAAMLGCGLIMIFWPIVYSDSLSAKRMVVDAVLVPVACLLGGLRWTYEMVNMMMWVLIRIPKISTGLEGDKHGRLMKIAIVFTVCRLLTEGAVSGLPLCVLLLTPALMDKCVAYYDKYREPVVKPAGPQSESPVDQSWFSILNGMYCFTPLDYVKSRNDLCCGPGRGCFVVSDISTSTVFETLRYLWVTNWSSHDCTINDRVTYSCSTSEVQRSQPSSSFYDLNT
ncbi:hypothetical protein BDM02DRAFT_2542728 [Thelephora ganbajun]|uniref:Uncharacterized protein n=1 Tax=Thelephora ganbajun TaxID=370292 RepID=A0ACB6ZS23_THEGA|nr:hypothetical protein BDM02DRAFT_2542728 [Thelephora ganbajun]